VQQQPGLIRFDFKPLVGLQSAQKEPPISVDSIMQTPDKKDEHHGKDAGDF
jgi:hypothetical protein